jgi:hypothetical protein
MTSGRNQISPTGWKWVKDGWIKGEPHTGWGSLFVFEASSFIILSRNGGMKEMRSRRLFSVIMALVIVILSGGVKL